MGDTGARARETWLKVAAALVPIGLAALVTLAWQNSHALTLLAHDEADLRSDMERIEARLIACQGNQK
jgi:hypothetical protein